VAVEILTVSLSDESVEKIALAIVRMTDNNHVGTQSNPPSSETHRTRNDGVSETRADPWVGGDPSADAGPCGSAVAHDHTTEAASPDPGPDGVCPATP
jgi:hypothetical protein